MYTIAITGGIGSGKSVVSSILRVLGYNVYDSDSEAKRLMDSSKTIQAEIADKISVEAITGDGTIDRTVLGRIVFSDGEALDRLNAIVHSSVRNHFSGWRKAMDIAFIETAILYQSHIDTMVDEVWEVTAPIDLRIRRVMTRNNISAEQVRARIEAQQFLPDAPHSNVHIIENSVSTPVLPQILGLLNMLNSKIISTLGH